MIDPGLSGARTSRKICPHNYSGSMGNVSLLANARGKKRWAANARGKKRCWKSSNTKNTKENRKVVVARYNTDVLRKDGERIENIPFVFKLPDNLDLEDETIVSELWGVKRGVLNIPYTNKENYIKYTGNTPVA